MNRASSEKGTTRKNSKKSPTTTTLVASKTSNSPEISELVPQKDVAEDTDEESSVPALTSIENFVDTQLPLGAGPQEGKEDDASKSPAAPEGSMSMNAEALDAAMSKIQGSAHEGTGTSISSHIQRIIARELSAPAKKGRIDLQSVPMKEYLEQTVLPIVQQGLMALARERPGSAIEYLAAYFLKHKHKYQSSDHDHEVQQMYNSGSNGDKEQQEKGTPGDMKTSSSLNIPPQQSGTGTGSVTQIPSETDNSKLTVQ